MGITYLAYENCRDTHFGMWCNKFAQEHAIPLRYMQLNDHLFNWYCEQWQKLVELPFYMDHEDYLTAGIRDEQNLQDLFLQYTDAIEEIYPKVLLRNIADRHKQRTDKPNIAQ